MPFFTPRSPVSALYLLVACREFSEQRRVGHPQRGVREIQQRFRAADALVGLEKARDGVVPGQGWVELYFLGVREMCAVLRRQVMDRGN